MTHRIDGSCVRFSPGIAFLGALALGACAKVSSQSASMQATPGVVGTAALIQLQAFETGRRISMILERAADSIRAASADPVVQRNALLFKISGVPLAQESALRPDPVIAAADLLAFTLQLSEYLTTGSGSTSFGAQQPIAVAAAAEAERSARALVEGNLVGGQLPAEGEANVRAWAAAHPMTGPELKRASLLSSAWKALGLSDNSLASTVGNVDRTLTGLTYRLSYLNETLAAQARWNAELAGEDALNSPRADSMLGTGYSAIRSVGLFADDFPALFDRERVALMRDVDRQRILAFEEIAVQRVALEAALDAEREALMSDVREERIAAFRSIDSVAARTIDQAGAMIRRVVFQIAVVAMAVVVLLLVGGLALVNRWRAAGLQRAPS